tara:strand:- start:317 stop:862 length:546 start_codon:yes stop_codon:yes gene_type:complete
MATNADMARRSTIIWMTAGLLLAGSAWVLRPDTVFIWNRTSSAPLGLYLKLERSEERPLTPGSRVLLGPESSAGHWIISHGFAGSGWPIIKSVRAQTGDEICRNGPVVSINSKPVATAQETTSSGRRLPEWQGCRVLGEGEIFLLNDHPYSLDGRYFGATDIDDILGIAVPIWTYQAEDAP